MADGLPAADGARVRLGAVRSTIAAWLLVGVVDAVALALMAPPATLSTRLLHHGVDFFQMVALGLIAAAAVAGSSKLVRGRAFVPVVALSFFSALFALFALAPDFESFADRMKRPWLQPAGAVLTSLAAPLSLIAGRLLDRPWFRLLALAGAGGALAMHH